MKIVTLSLTSFMLTAASIGYAAPPSERPKEGAVVSQIETDAKATQRARIESVDVAVGETRKTSAVIGQLPSDAQAPDDGVGPEANIGISAPGPAGGLYGEVAEVWTMIRKRGLQPSPELIAREIGPDTLAQFLDKYPGAADMFGVDQDVLPVDPTGGGTDLPGAGVTISLPNSGGN